MAGGPIWVDWKIAVVDFGLPSYREKTRQEFILRKEVIQPQVPLRLPCYDLVPITEFIFGACFP